MKYTIKEISNILNSPILDPSGKEEQIITNFEYQAIHLNNTETAFFSISSNSWSKFLGRKSKLTDGNKQINKNIKNIGLIITEEYIEGLNFKIPQIIVENSIEALKTLAVTIRENYKNPIVAITGSMGKSSTRLMVAQALKNYKVLENRANSNTRSAVLLQMCKLASNPDFAIFEVSLNALNNRGNFSLILKPDIAIVTGIGSAHLSTIGSEVDIATFKSRIFYGLKDSGIAIINQGTMHSDILIENAQKATDNIMTYDLEQKKGTIEILG
ncbi:Mur ligase family protein [Mammaliicoccus sciuri]